METRTFRGKELALVMGSVRDACGEDALIVGTRYLPDRSVEVDVVIERTSVPRSQRQARLKQVHHVVQLESPLIHEEHPALDLLRSAGIRAPLLEQIADGLGTKGSLMADVAAGFESALRFDSSLAPQRRGDPRVIALVGPTGVGKTTTIAKLAAQIRLAFDVKVALISADSFRVGAAHQLQTYASLLKIPCRTICPPGASRVGAAMVERIDEALDEFRDMDLILVDTAGVGARDKERLAVLQESLGEGDYIERILVLQAPGNDRDFTKIAEAFAPLQYSRIIITKLDETLNPGPVLNLANQLRKPIAFLCHGQRVPEDVEPATAKRLAWMVTSQIH